MFVPIIDWSVLNHRLRAVEVKKPSTKAIGKLELYLAKNEAAASNCILLNSSKP